MSEVRLTPEEKDALAAPLPQRDLWDLEERDHQLRGAGCLIAFCAFCLVAAAAVVAVPMWIVLHLRR